jgi:hypothetical protein
MRFSSLVEQADQPVRMLSGVRTLIVNCSCYSLSATWRTVRVLAVTVCVVGVCTALATGVSASAPIVYGSPVVRDAEVLLVPPIQGGSSGWCLVVVGDSFGCGGLQVPDSPIFTESWGGEGTPNGSELIEGSAVTTSTVAAVSINGGASIPTRTESALPAGLRAVAVEIHLRTGPSRTPLPHFTALNASGEVIPQPSGQAQYASVDLPGTRGWKRPAPVARGACRLTAAGLSRLSAQWGAVLTRISPYTGSVGQPFISCISTEFYLNNWPLLSGVLLDGGHPGAAPASLPAMSPLPGHPGIVVAPGAEGQMVARRIPKAWLVVDGGKDLKQRLTLLQHLRVTIHL